MTTTSSKGIFWSARILAIVFTGFLSIFVLEAFTNGYEFPQILVAIFMDLVPAIIIASTIIISWRRGWIGGVVFAALGAFYIFWSWGKFDWTVHVLITGPLFILSILYFTSWRLDKVSLSQ